ncbi:melanoma-associated antigen 4-like [Sorex araneus]|uniref:melanoma-associated antigen 4-like n=1 Tax=Sorex araneus TaxID=42254 RepID=UPI0024334312|nr:melanoma-associated antigen 4-like [Sorex araneus]
MKQKEQYLPEREETAFAVPQSTNLCHIDSENENFPKTTQLVFNCEFQEKAYQRDSWIENQVETEYLASEPKAEQKRSENQIHAQFSLWVRVRPGLSQQPAQDGAGLQEALHDKMSNLVGFLLLKYRTKQLTTKEVILRTILNNDEENFSFILSQVSECLQLVFGIDVKEINPQIHSYVLVTTLGLTYDGMVGPQQTMPNTGLLVMVLGVILLEDDCASEQTIWEQLALMGVYPGRKHFIYGEPRELLTNVWVQNQYLDYRREPGSYPARYQFLWGLRAHAETSKVEVMEFLLNIINSDNRPLTFLTDRPLCKDEDEVA